MDESVLRQLAWERYLDLLEEQRLGHEAFLANQLPRPPTITYYPFNEPIERTSLPAHELYCQPFHPINIIISPDSEYDKEFGLGPIEYYDDDAYTEFSSVDGLDVMANSALVNNQDIQVMKEIHTEAMDNFKNTCIAVDASYYLQTLLDTPPTSEPLLPAMGGFPLSLKKHIENDLAKWAAHEMYPLFVFEGQSIVGKEDVFLKSAKESSVLNQAAWNQYSTEQADLAVVAFGHSATVKAHQLYAFFQQILIAKNVAFTTASHSACAHIAQLDREAKITDGIMGPLELLLYDLAEGSCLITKVDFERETVQGVVKADLLKKLNLNEDAFLDVVLMTGTSFLPPFPALKDPGITPRQPFSVKEAINMYRTAGGSIRGVCEMFNDILQKHDPTWEDKYRKSKMAVKHTIVVGENGNFVVRQFDQLTGDNHEYVGLQLPEEFYGYLTKSVIGNKPLNWLSSLEMLIFPPLDGGDAEEYRRLVTEQLIPVQEQTIALYTSRMHRAFQHKNVTMRFWFDETTNIKLNHQAVSPQPSTVVQTWCVKKDTFKNKAEELKRKPGSFAFAVLSLKDKKFAESTISQKGVVGAIVDADEVVANTMWRFLHLRGYINDNHQLTKWGIALAASIEALGSNLEQEEPAFLAIEILQYNQFNPRLLHQEWIGSPRNGSEGDQFSCTLISRCACLLKLRHEEIGWTGPLSKNLLAHHSIITTIRESDRNMGEAVLATMFMYAHADRKRDDWHALALSLPFAHDVHIGMGIAVKTWLDDFINTDVTPEDKLKLKNKFVEKQIPHSENFMDDLDLAFTFFDAVYAGVKTLGDAVTDRAVWDEASSYLAARR